MPVCNGLRRVWVRNSPRPRPGHSGQAPTWAWPPRHGRGHLKPRRLLHGWRWDPEMTPLEPTIVGHTTPIETHPVQGDLRRAVEPRPGCNRTKMPAKPETAPDAKVREAHEPQRPPCQHASHRQQRWTDSLRARSKETARRRRSKAWKASDMCKRSHALEPPLTSAHKTATLSMKMDTVVTKKSDGESH